MAKDQELLSKARELGGMLAKHPAVEKLNTAMQAMDDDVDAQRAMADLERHGQALAEKERSGQPVEVDDKRKLQELQMKVVGSKTLRDMQAAQMDYVDLMRRVDQAMTESLPTLAQ